MRAGTHAFITHGKNCRDRINLVWHPQRGKPAILGDYTSDTDGVQMIADPDMKLTGLNIDSTLATAAVEGGLYLASKGADSDEVALEPHTLANNSPWGQITWGTDQETEWETVIEVSSDFAQRTWKAGMCLVPANTDVSTDVDQVGFMGSTDGAIDVIVSINNNDTIVTGAQTALVSQYIHLSLKFDSVGDCHFCIDGREVTGAVNGAFRGNAVDLVPYGGALLELTNPTTPRINCLGMAVSRAIGA